MLLVRNETKCLKEFKCFVFFYDRLIRRMQVLLSIVIFGERPKLMQLVGIIICIIAVILINFEKEQTVISFKLGLILTLIVSGFCEGMSKVHEELENSVLSEHFLLYTFGVALICAIVLIVIRKEPVGVQDIGFGILLGVPNYFSCRFLLKALNSVPAVIAFPTFSVSAVVIVTLAGLFVFKEKLSKKQWISLGIILVALIMLNI